MHSVSATTIATRQRRDALKIKLGNVCARCKRPGLLQFDCIEPRGAWHHITGSKARIRFYEAQAAMGNLQLLCVPCHRSKTSQDALERRAQPKPAQTSEIAWHHMPTFRQPI